VCVCVRERERECVCVPHGCLFNQSLRDNINVDDLIAAYQVMCALCHVVRVGERESVCVPRCCLSGDVCLVCMCGCVCV